MQIFFFSFVTSNGENELLDLHASFLSHVWKVQLNLWWLQTQGDNTNIPGSHDSLDSVIETITEFSHIMLLTEVDQRLFWAKLYYIWYRVVYNASAQPAGAAIALIDQINV